MISKISWGHLWTYSVRGHIRFEYVRGHIGFEYVRGQIRFEYVRGPIRFEYVRGQIRRTAKTCTPAPLRVCPKAEGTEHAHVHLGNNVKGKLLGCPALLGLACPARAGLPC